MGERTDQRLERKKCLLLWKILLKKSGKSGVATIIIKSILYLDSTYAG